MTLRVIGAVVPGMGMDRATVHSGTSANGSVLADARLLRRPRATKVPASPSLDSMKESSGFQTLDGDAATTAPGLCLCPLAPYLWYPCNGCTAAAAQKNV